MVRTKAMDCQHSFPLDPTSLVRWRKRIGPDGMKIDETFKPDFLSFPTGPGGAHDMLLR